MSWRKSWPKLNIYGLNGEGKGSKRQLLPDERSVWDDYLDLAQISPIRGKVCIAIDIGYTYEQLSKILKTPQEILIRAEKRLVQLVMIEVDKNRVITILNWPKYQSEYDRQLQYRVTKKGYKKKLQRKDTKKTSVSPSVSISKDKYLNYVLLTKEEYKKLCDLFGKGQADNMIEKLNNYIGSKGKQYKSHYFTILNWAGKDGIRRQVPVKSIDPKKDFKDPSPKEQAEVAKLVSNLGQKLDANREKKGKT